MISLRHNLHRNNCPERITSAPRNLDRRIEDNTRKLITVYLPYVKGLAERIQKIRCPYDIRTVFTSGLTLQRYLFRVKPPTEFNMIKNCVYSIPCSCGKIYKGETGPRLWLTESVQVTPVDSIKDVFRISVNVPESDKHLKKASGHIDRNVAEITIKMKTIVRKPLMIKITDFHLRNLDHYY